MVLGGDIQKIDDVVEVISKYTRLLIMHCNLYLLPSYTYLVHFIVLKETNRLSYTLS